MEISEDKLLAQCGDSTPLPKTIGTPLQLAITIGSLKMVDMLVTAGACLEPTDVVKPLHWSIAFNKLKIAEYLINRGANINALSDGKNPMHVAAEKGHKEIVELLLKKGADLGGILDAIENQHFEVAKILLDAGAELNPKKSCPPLLSAVAAKSCEFVEYLIKRGANINAEFNGKTAVHLAALHNNQEMLELLIKHGADLNISTSMGLPIHSAIDQNLFSIVKILLKAGADLYAPTHVGSVSQFALRSNQPHFVEFFLDIGVDFRDEWYLDLINAGCCDEEMKRKFKHHIVKLKVARFPVTPRNLQFIEDEEFNDFYTKCAAEVKLMKNKKIGSTNVSFYDVLRKSKEEIADCLKRLGEDIGVTESELKKKFPLYGSWVSYRLEYQQGKNLAGADND